MKVDLETIQELAKDAVKSPDTGDAWLDSQLQDYAKLVGHPNPYYKLWWLIAREFQPNTVVELGAYRGNGAAAFASGGIMTVVATIDIHREDKDAQMRCRLHADHYHNLFYFNGWTWDDDIVKSIAGNFSPIDVLIIDAWHEYKYAMREWELYSPLLADEALVICDDIFDAEGATVDMKKFWHEITGPYYHHFIDTDVHSGIPVGFLRYIRG